MHRLVLLAAVLLAAEFAAAEDDPSAAEEQISTETQGTRLDEAALEEDPEARRRKETDAGVEQAPTADRGRFSLDLYGSVRTNVINTFDPETGDRSVRVGDGNSRAGARVSWEYAPGWNLIGRGEAGFDAINQFTTRGPEDGDGGLTRRLLFAGVDSDNLTLTYGTDWSTFYSIAGITDRFAIFGGSASGVYNAGTAGNATGTGRADEILKARIWVDSDVWMFSGLKPGSVNLQYQQSQPIPRVDGASYDYGVGASAWIETQTEYGIGIAYNVSRVPDSAAVRDAGIDGDAIALALSTRMFGERWYASLLLTRLENVETTDLDRYFNGDGIEVYAQWEVFPKWWLIGGLNALEPDSDDPDAGEYRVRYGVIGGRYSIRSFERMLYFEYRIDDSRSFDGSPLSDEVTFGLRWDFGN